MKLGFLGGSFDPVHHGHLLAAQDALEALGLEKVVFIPSARTPLKAGRPELSAEGRLELLALALEGVPYFEASTMEVDRGGVSYTVETARSLRERYPRSELYWIIGADQARGLRQWHRIEELAGLLAFACVGRPGSEEPGPELAVEGLRVCPVESHLCDISSSDIRERLRSGRPIHFLTPSRVVERITEKGWYRAVAGVGTSDRGPCAGSCQSG